MWTAPDSLNSPPPRRGGDESIPDILGGEQRPEPAQRGPRRERRRIPPSQRARPRNEDRARGGAPSPRAKARPTPRPYRAPRRVENNHGLGPRTVRVSVPGRESPFRGGPSSGRRALRPRRAVRSTWTAHPAIAVIALFVRSDRSSRFERTRTGAEKRTADGAGRRGVVRIGRPFPKR